MTKLAHQPFSDWLLAEEPLSSEEARLLQEHLRTCPECQQQQVALTNVHRLFKDVSQLVPAHGFVSRWQQRLADQRTLRQRKIAWVWFAVSAVLASLALTFLGYQAFGSLQSPLSLLAVWIYRLTVIVSYWNSLEGYLDVFRGLWPGLPLVGLVFLTGFTSFFSVLWLATYKRLRATRRVVNET